MTILFPILLMMGKAAVDLVLPGGHPVRTLFEFIGHPIVALLLAVLLGMWTFGFFLGKDTRLVGKLLGDALPPVASIMLIIGAGGALEADADRCRAGPHHRQRLATGRARPAAAGLVHRGDHPAGDGDRRRWRP